MKHLKIFFSVLMFLLLLPLFSQSGSNLLKWNPATNAFPVIEGQAWPSEVKNPYDRLPARMENSVRKAVWHLSENSSGLLIRFRTNATRIVVKYSTGNKTFNMPHMPATGVSGLDLYAINCDGKTSWCRGEYSFGDTIQYNFNGLNPNEKYHRHGHEYRLYLPLYNSVKWMEISVPQGAEFIALPTRTEKPIVAYGTSITQGACASRPAMAWTAILGRKMDRPVINLGFSGNAYLEDEIINAMTEVDAKIYVLDCMPNMVDETRFSKEQIVERLCSAVNKLKTKRPHIPILLTEHEGYADGLITDKRRTDYQRTNEATKQAFQQLTNDGVKNLFLLTKEEINQPLDFSVDGTHPSDLGMQRYADAYELKIRGIINEPIGKISTTQPCTQLREPDNYNWEMRHFDHLKMNSVTPPEIVFFGNSITHFWGGDAGRKATGGDSWNKIMEPIGVQNFGCGWDRIENVLWRVYHDELDGYSAKQVLIKIGTNNLEMNTDEEIAEGLKFLVKAIQVRQPNAKVTMLAVLPRRNLETRVETLNKLIKKEFKPINVAFVDAGALFKLKNGKIDETLFSDGLHPNAEGYRRFGQFLKPILEMNK